MPPAEKQRQLTTQYLPIEDPQERLALLMDRARKVSPPTEGERIEANRVQGCVSRVWLVCTVQDGRCRFRLDADSALVKGLAALVCEVYEGSLPTEAAEFECTILDALKIAGQLSPTRQHGLEQVARKIRDFARGAAPTP
jgi:cysteine desulfuration protein SufE